MIYVSMQGHDYDDDFYEIIRAVYTEESIVFVDSPSEINENSISFISIYQEPIIQTKTFLPGKREIFSEEITLTSDQRKDENVIRHEVIKSFVNGINAIEL